MVTCMVNEPLPHQLTVGELRQIIADAPDTTIIAFAVPASKHDNHTISTICNLTAVYTGGPILMFRRSDPPEQSRRVADFDDHPNRLTPSLKGALYWFVEDLTKGLLQDDNWNFDPEMFDDERLDWDRYLAVIQDPTIIKMVYTIWSNNLELNTHGAVLNELHARFRAFQYLRSQFDDSYTHDLVEPEFATWELEEAQF